ncbi:hypothetical protein ACFLR8_04490, partial [Bacteroidota bacterium]
TRACQYGSFVQMKASPTLHFTTGVRSCTEGITRGATCPEISENRDSLIELVYPNGTLLRIKNDLDLADLRTLIHLYD